MTAYLLGLDIGSSAIKASLIDSETGRSLASAGSPEVELEISSPQPGFAEQDPDVWWRHVVAAVGKVKAAAGVDLSDVAAVGISYQMHGLVAVDDKQQPLRPAIIWCDSRAVDIGNAAFREIGKNTCLTKLLNSPGNFTASKLKWVKENEPRIYSRIHKVMLPGDYIAMRLTGEIKTTPSGLSEGVIWDFTEEKLADTVLEYYGIGQELIADVAPTFSIQGQITKTAAAETGLKTGTPVSYRAGDQPNNAFSLNVLDPGDIAATAGTSGVIYGVSSSIKPDAESRVNTFLHVNHTSSDPRYGTLLCVNGTGILNSWIRRLSSTGGSLVSYKAMDEAARVVAPGADGLRVLPYGNGAERSLGNRDTGASVHNLSLVRHTPGHFFRAAQEGIVFALSYGLEIMNTMGIDAKKIRAGNANMFLSPVFSEVLSACTGATIELYVTDGAEGAARGAGIGAKVYASPKEAFENLAVRGVIEPSPEATRVYKEIYQDWKDLLLSALAK